MSSNPDEGVPLAIRASEALEFILLIVLFASVITIGSKLYPRLSEIYRSYHLNEHAAVIQEFSRASFLDFETS